MGDVVLEYGDLVDVSGETKYDGGKPRWNLVPMKELEGVAKVMTFGANKYADDGWKRVSKDRYVAALMRHVVAYMSGEIIDDESGLPHMAHVMTNALFIDWKDNNEYKSKPIEQECEDS